MHLQRRAQVLNNTRTCARQSISHTHTHTHTYVPTIHCGESALWGKSVRPSWSLWGTYTHTHTHTCVVVAPLVIRAAASVNAVRTNPLIISLMQRCHSAALLWRRLYDVAGALLRVLTVCSPSSQQHD